VPPSLADPLLEGPAQLIIFREKGLAYERRRLENVLTVRARKTLGDNDVLLCSVVLRKKEEKSR